MRVAWSEKGMLVVVMVDRIGCGGGWWMVDGGCRQCDRMKLLFMSVTEPSVVV